MIADIIKEEEKRQESVINLIASENYPSPQVLEAIASPFISKYAEGYPCQRYYAGNSVADKLESYVQYLAQTLFSTDYHVNVQPYSGSVANLAVYFGLIFPGDKIMGLELSSGGHLTHGHKVSMSGTFYTQVPYSVSHRTQRLDYEEMRRIAREHMPQIIISGYTAYSRTIDFKKISDIAHEVGALHLADISHISGMVASDLHPTPFGNADVVMTTTHKMLRGPRGAMIFCRPDLAKKIDRAVFPGIQGGPHLNTIAGIGVCLEEASKKSYHIYVEQVVKNAMAFADELSKNGLDVITGGTDNHLMLVDVSKLGLTGQEAQDKLEANGIIVNRNAIPFDEAPPLNPSGIRLGTTPMTTKGYREMNFRNVAKLIAKILKTTPNHNSTS